MILVKDLEFRQDTPELRQSHLLNLDSDQGRDACRSHLDSVKRLIHILEITKTSRDYRQSFSASYKQMLSGGGYLIDILDSAQEAFPYMWVNGEKYVFSDHVIEKGNALYSSLMNLTEYLPSVTSLDRIEQLKTLITRFDQDWARYEAAYIGELMVIEHDARRFIRNLVAGSFDTPKAFCEMIGEINSVANTEGQGRKDFDHQVLETARALARSDSAAVRTICQKIEDSFTNITEYARGVKLDFVDP